MSQVTVCSPMCGCGPTSSPLFSVTSAGPMWSAKHQAPMVRRPLRGSARRTRNRPTSASRLSVTSMQGALGWLPSAVPGGASTVPTGPLITAPGCRTSRRAVGDQLDAGAVRIAEVDRDVAVDLVGHAGLVQPADDLL